MNPYIMNADRANPIGKMVAEYGDNQWNKGFIIGHISGLCVGGIIAWIILSKKR